MKHKTIFHIDMNCFFCSVEELLNPSLKNKPVLVGGKSRRSVVSSPNYEARKYGIRAAMPIYRALQLCPNVIVIEPHFEKYKKYSDAFFELLIEKFTKNVEMASIDECYIDVSDILKKKTPKILAIKIQNTIKNILGLNVSIGIGQNRFTAKMSSNLKKPLGIEETLLKDIPSKLWPLPICEMHMVGPATANVLIENNIHTIGDLAKTDINILEEILGSRAQSLYDNANGIGDDNLVYEATPAKSISKACTFEYNIDDYDEIISHIKEQAKDVWEQLGVDSYKHCTINLYIKTSRTTTIRKSKTYKDGINFEKFISGLLNLYENNFLNKSIRLIGVSISNI